jgi:hypothetical protein
LIRKYRPKKSDGRGPCGGESYANRERLCPPCGFPESRFRSSAIPIRLFVIAKKYLSRYRMSNLLLICKNSRMNTSLLDAAALREFNRRELIDILDSVRYMNLHCGR